MSNKTQDPCDCGVISDMLNYPEITGLTFDEKYGFQLGGSYMVYHCPFCGGLLPDTSKPVWYPRLTAAERARLEHLFEGITTPEQAIERLGQPDYDVLMDHYDSVDGGMPLIVSEDDDVDDPHFVFNAARSKQDRNLVYYHLSAHADIEIYFDRDHGVHYRIQTKCISPHHVEEAANETATL